jgi:hypothetical protein
VKALPIAVAGVIATLALGSFVPDSQAEKIDQTYVKSVYRSASKTTVAFSDAEGHEVAQELGIAVTRYSNPAFNVKEEWDFIHSDLIGGSGPQRGYYVYYFEDGEQAYGTFEGAVNTVAGQDGSWKSTWEGTYRYVGGTGKYKNIKGTGKYKGSIGSKEPFHEEGKETIEY